MPIQVQFNYLVDKYVRRDITSFRQFAYLANFSLVSLKVTTLVDFKDFNTNILPMYFTNSGYI